MAPPAEPIEVEVQVRYRSGAVAARSSPLPPTDADAAAGRPHRCRLDFAEQQFSITPGQAAVFYAGEVSAGGRLDSALIELGWGVLDSRSATQPITPFPDQRCHNRLTALLCVVAPVLFKLAG